MGGIKSRKSPRAQVSLVARYRSPTAFEFVHEECFDLSAGGMFIKSRSPAPSGTLLKLECDVDGGTAKIRGVARVVWLREQDSDGHPAGMGVKFVKLDPGGREVISAILDRVGANMDEGGVARRSSVPPRGSQPYRPTPLPALAAVPAQAAAPAAPAAPDITTPAPFAALATEPEADAITVRPQPIEPPPVPAVASITARAATPVPAAEAKAKTPVPAAKTPVPEAKDSGKSSGKGKGKKKGKKESGRPRAKDAAEKSSGSARAAAAAPRSVEPPQPSQRRGSRVLVYVAAAAIAGLGTYALASRRSADNASHGETEAAAVTEEPATQAPVASTPAPEVTVAPEPTPEPAPAAQPAEPAAAAAEPAPPPPAPQYVLEVVTRPEGAEVSIAGQRIVTPGELKLGTLDAPVVVKAEKKGFLSAAATIDRVGFMLDEGAMRRRVVFKLNEAEEADREPRKRREKAPAASEKPKSEEPALAAVAQGEPKPRPAEEPRAEEPKAEPKPKQTAMQAAMACLGNGDNGCVVAALEGKAKSAQELELLIETHRAMGNADKAEKYMQTYLNKYPSERRAANYKRVLERRAGEPEAAAP